jgi:TonB family protein
MHRELVFTVMIFGALCAWSQTAAPSTSESPKQTLPTTVGQLEDSKSLVAIKTQKAVYPMQAQEKQIQGRVLLQVLIDETGNVEKVEAVEGNPVLVDAAVSAMKKWKFKPYIKDGKPVKVNIKLPMDFAFSEKIKDQKEPEDTVSPEANSSQSSINSSAKTQDSSLPTASNAGLGVPTRVRISQGVTRGLLIHRVNPVYPPDARRNHVEGKVLLNAVIGTDGSIKNLQVVSGPKELIDSAVGAVQQWRYRPYLLQNRPVEVETTIEVNYLLRP